jgi:PAS domain S-box-containing protein
MPALALETARREGKYETEGWRVRKDGSRFWALVVIDPVRDEAGQIIGFAKVTRDITERRSAQEALRDSERQFRLLISGVVDYAIYMLDPNGVVVSWNTGAQKIKGYDPEEIIGQHFSRFYTEEDRGKGAPTRALYAATSEGSFAGEGWRMRKDGTQFWASVVIDAIHDERGQLIGFAKITRDITEQREAQLALQRAQEQLAHAQKMDALGQLTGGIAHDFNNLLTIVAGQARILKKLTIDSRGIEAAEAIETTVQRGASLTRQLLGFSRRQPLEPRRVSLSDRLPGLEGMLSASFDANTRLISHVLPDTWPVMADASELELAIMNLVLNARDAMAEGGTITIMAENCIELPSGMSTELSGSFVAISVVDTGSGIPPEVLAKVFDPFFTTKKDGKGTGLGLAQVYGFVHQSGGTCAIETEVGKGTRVMLYLPRADGNQPSEKASGAPAAAPRLYANVLVVEDNSDVTEVTSALIKQLGHTVKLAKNAEEALRVLEDSPVDLVFSDIMMPGEMDGIALARAIQRLRPRLPVLLASGSNKLVEDAAAEFVALQKPYDEGALDQAIQDLLRRRDKMKAAGQLVDLQSAKRRRGSSGNADR